MNKKALAVALGFGYLATLVAIGSPTGLFVGLLTQLMFALPGVLIVRVIAGASLAWMIPLSFGPLIGQGLGSLVLTGLWAAGGRGVWLLMAAPAIVSLLAIPARRLEGRWRLPSPDAREWIALSTLLLLVPLIVGLPFAHVGTMTPDGQAYRAYFTADYVWRRAVVAEPRQRRLPSGQSVLPLRHAALLLDASLAHRGGIPRGAWGCPS